MNQKQYDIPLALPVTAQDRFECTLGYIIQAVVSFDQHLNADVLAKAVRLSLDAEPILGCRIIEDEKQPYWQRFDNLDEMPWFECINPDQPRESMDRFIKGPFFREGQQINVCLVQAADGDTLGVKISHACADAGGIKEYLQLLAGIYTRLQEDPDYRPQPHTQGRRDQKHYFDALGISDPMALFDPQAQPLPPAWAFPHHGTERKEMHLAMRRFKDEAFDRIIGFAKDHSVTVTAILLTAMFRSMFEMTKPPVGEKSSILVSFDLRHAFVGNPDQALCNLTMGVNSYISRQEDESFTETLQRASGALEEIKHNRGELTGAISLEAMATMDYSLFRDQVRAYLQVMAETGKNDPLLSNVGVIAPIYFGQSRAVDVYMLTPVVIPPGFMAGAMTYDKTLTLQISFAEPAHRREDVERFMDLMEQELRFP